MPVMDGYELMKLITKRKWNVKIAILTASVLEEDKQMCANLGIRYLITKPIEYDQLKNVIFCLTRK